MHNMFNIITNSLINQISCKKKQNKIYIVKKNIYFNPVAVETRGSRCI